MGHDIVLFHGTWAPGSAWTQDGSRLRSTVEREFPGCSFHVPDWGGGNTHGARIRAGRKLRALLEALDPDTDKVVVAHSHGANAALYALRAMKGTRNPPRLACLGTPFIQCSELGAFSHVAHAAWMPLTLVPALAVASPLSAILPSSGAAFVVVVLAWVAAAVAIFWALRAWLKGRAARLAEQLVWPTLGPGELFSVTYRTDEPTLALGWFSRILRFLANLAWAVAAILLALLILYVAAAGFLYLTDAAAYQKPPFSILVRDALPALQGSFIGSSIPESVYALRIHYAILATAAYAMYVPLIWAFAYALPALRGHPLALGWEWPSTSLFLKFDVIHDAKCVSRGALHVLLTYDRKRVPRSCLGHTAIHSDPRAIRRLVDWMKLGRTDRHVGRVASG